VVLADAACSPRRLLAIAAGAALLVLAGGSIEDAGTFKAAANPIGPRFAAPSEETYATPGHQWFDGD
jgi:hypothetical protein